MRSLFPILELLNAAGVQYAVVGGLAVIAHGHARLTTHVDVVLNMESDNLLRAVRALTAAGYSPRAPVDPEGLANKEIRTGWVETKHMTVLSMTNRTNPLLSVDLFAEPPLDATRILQGAETVELGGMKVPVCSLADLIEMKRISGRAMDLADIQALEQIHGKA